MINAGKVGLAMKRKEDVLKIIKDMKGDLKRFQVLSLSLFGSVARGEESASSDIDILVEFSEPVGIFTFIRLNNFLEEILSCKVDLVTHDALKDRFREKILKEAIRAA